MKKILIIIFIVLSIIAVYLTLCFCGSRIKYCKNDVIIYKNIEYIKSDFISLSANYKELIQISRVNAWYNPLLHVSYYAKTKKSPDIIICPNGNSVYFRKDIDFYNIKLKCYFGDEEGTDYYLSLNDILADMITDEQCDLYKKQIAKNSYSSSTTISLEGGDDLLDFETFIVIYQFDEIICDINDKLYYGTEYLINLM